MSEPRLITTVGSDGEIRHMTPAELETLVRDERARKRGVELRCPKPKYRWKPGTPGPCGRKIGELFPVFKGSEVHHVELAIFAPVELVEKEPPHWCVLREPSVGRFIEPHEPHTGQSVSHPGTISINHPEPHWDWEAQPQVDDAPKAATLILLWPDRIRVALLECPRCSTTNTLLTLTGRRLMS